MKAKEIILDNNLRPNELFTYKNEDYEKKFFLKKLIDLENNEFQNLIIEDNISGDFYHKNYIKYLYSCWANHYGIIVSPDILWHLILTQISIVVKSDPEKFQHLFTDSKDKQEILVRNLSGTDLNLQILYEELKKKIPNDINAFCPEFSTTTESSRTAFCAAFSDMASPYYDYHMSLCGIPKIKVFGTEDDFLLMKKSIHDIISFFQDHTAITSYLNDVLPPINNLSENDSEVWKDFFYVVECGSGHPYKVCGWINKFFIKEYSDVEIYPCANIVKYKNIDTNIKYEKYVGLFCSSLDDDNYLIPEFSYIVLKDLKDC